MPSRARDITITPLRHPGGSVSYRVLGTPVPGKPQRKQIVSTHEEAVEIKAGWEMERVASASSHRERFTSLTHAELRECEAAKLLIPPGTNIRIIDAVRAGLSQLIGVSSRLLLRDALDQFLKEREPHLSRAQYENYRVRGAYLCTFLGEGKLLYEVKTSDIEAALKAKKVDDREISPKTWNNLRGDFGAIFEWCRKAPRRWIVENPVDGIEKFDPRKLRKEIERLSATTAREMMAHLEQVQPNWCCFFAVALFLGVRPDMRQGEMARLAREVAVHGPNNYFKGEVLDLPRAMTKDRRRRRIAIPANVKEWLKRYPPTSASLCPGYDDGVYNEIRTRFKIPHDGLRHTAISAMVTRLGSFAEVAKQAGNSETIIRAHYLDDMGEAETEEFYQIFPALKPEAHESAATFSGSKAQELDFISASEFRAKVQDAAGAIVAQGPVPAPLAG